MTMAKALITILNILMIIVLTSCTIGRTWRRDKATLIGFGFMASLYVANSIMIWG